MLDTAICKIKKEREKAIEKQRKLREQARTRKIRQRGKKNKEIPTIPSISDAEFTAVVRRFESMNSSLSYGQCSGCQQVRLEMKIDRCTVEGTSMMLCISCQKNQEFVLKMQKTSSLV